LRKQKAQAYREANPRSGASPLSANAPNQKKKQPGTVFGQANTSYETD